MAPQNWIAVNEWCWRLCHLTDTWTKPALSGTQYNVVNVLTSYQVPISSGLELSYIEEVWSDLRSPNAVVWWFGKGHLSNKMILFSLAPARKTL